MEYPDDILLDVYWAFREPTFDSMDAFVSELKSYHEDISGEKLELDFDEVIFNFPTVRIQYIKYVDDEDDDDENEAQVELKADNGVSFTTKELFFKLHNQVGITLFDDDNCYFEGLSFADVDDDGVPNYFMMLGS